jgi:hypothetical protein
MTGLEQVGPALYGPRWQVELARALGVSDRTVRRWAVSGDLPAHHLPAVRKLIAERVKLLRSFG